MGSIDGDPPTVLVVDDERRVVDLYALQLRDEYEVRTAYGGEEALAVVDEAVDVVLLDRRMPDLWGDEVLEEIRDRGLDCRVIMLTAVDPDFDIVDMPFDDYLTKPVSSEDLVAAIEDQLSVADREVHAVEAKLEALESEKSGAALAESEEYERLQRRRERLEVDPGVDDG